MTQFVFNYQVSINAAPEAVWDQVADLTKHAEWNDDLAVEPSGEAPAGIGSEYTSLGKMMGRTFQNKLKVTEFNAPNRFCFVSNTGNIEVLHEFNLTQEGESTVLDRRVSGSANPMVATALKAFSPFAGRRMYKSLNKLKANLESGAG